jgi:hypothetical protein
LGTQSGVNAFGHKSGGGSRYLWHASWTRIDQHWRG